MLKNSKYDPTKRMRRWVSKPWFTVKICIMINCHEHSIILLKIQMKHAWDNIEIIERSDYAPIFISVTRSHEIAVFFFNKSFKDIHLNNKVST